jgi:hypothetical protein
MRRALLLRGLRLVLAVTGCAAGRAPGPAAARWTSRAVPEARGDVVTAADGTRRAVRYRGWTTEDFGRFRTYLYQQIHDPRAVFPATTMPPWG